MKLIATFAIIGTVLLAGCNTFKGLGKDVSKAGEAVTGTAEKTQQKL
jgi:entericidin B